MLSFLMKHHNQAVAAEEPRIICVEQHEDNMTQNHINVDPIINAMIRLKDHTYYDFTEARKKSLVSREQLLGYFKYLDTDLTESINMKRSFCHV